MEQTAPLSVSGAAGEAAGREIEGKGRLMLRNLGLLGEIQAQPK